jgi:uncharacterized protein (TIGR03435 family)
MGSHAARQRVIAIGITVAAAFTIAFCRTQSTPIQNATTPQPAVPLVFEVAAIRPNPGDTTGHSHIWSSPSDGHFKAQNVTAMALIQFAFAVPETRIAGGPGWMKSAKFDLEAKSDPAIDQQLRGLNSGEARERKQRMLQALLADRFALKVHEETRVLPVYAMVVAKSGPRFQPSNVNGTTVNNGRNYITVQGSDHTIRLLAEQLAKTLGRVVVDKTGLDGRFDLTLRWTPDDPGFAGPGAASADSGSGPSIFTAIQEQLGLKLESGKGPVPILVIDRLDMPSAN